MRVLAVQEHGLLLEFLFKAMKETPKTRVRQCLKHRSVLVNDKVTTRFDHSLAPGDKVSVLTLKEARPALKPQAGITVVFEDDAIIVIEKPAGLLTIATETVAKQTAFYLTNQYVCEAGAARSRKEDRREGAPPLKKMIFIVHRLDREASGLLVFAKGAEVKQKLQDGWSDARKKYYALVEGVPKEIAGTITSYLRENKMLNVYSTPDAHDAKLSTTRYRTLRSSPHYSLLEVALETGRKHQIRVHLSEMDHPIVGDERYGSKTDPAGRLGLHAFYLSLAHPVSGKELVFESPLPPVFEQVLKKDAGA